MAEHPNTTAWRLVPPEPDAKQLDAAVAFALNVSLSAEYSWSAYMRDLYLRFLKFAPAAPAPSLGPVRLPEPVAWLYHDAADVEALLANPLCHSTLLGLERQPLYRNETPLYTADQLRAAVEEDRRGR